MEAFITDPVFVGLFFSVIGWGVERFAPQWIPFFAIGKKVAKELLELHNQNDTPNEKIIETAEKAGMNLAKRELSKIIS